MSTNEKDHMEKIFRAAYYLIKSNQAFRNFSLLIELEELEGIKFTKSYKNDESAREVCLLILQRT